VPDDKLEDVPYFKPADDTAEMKCLHERRRALNGFLPQRRRVADEKMAAPALDAFAPVLEPTAQGREISTTQAFVRCPDPTGARQDKSVRVWSRSSRTRRARLGWKACSASSASIRRRDGCTSRSTATR
jgi:pyruvate dehydrogenase E1 component